MTTLSSAFPSVFGTFELRGHSSGHPSVSGLVRLEDVASVRDWLQDCTDIIDQVQEPQIVLVGSSLGGFLAVLAAIARPGRIKGLILLCPAVDLQHASWSISRPGAHFTDRNTFLVPSNYTGTDGIHVAASLMRATEETEGDLFLISGAEGAAARRLAALRSIPVHIIHGTADDVVPVNVSEQVAARLRSAGCSAVTLTMVPGGDHRLSSPSDLAQLRDAVQQMLDL